MSEETNLADVQQLDAPKLNSQDTLKDSPTPPKTENNNSLLFAVNLKNLESSTSFQFSFKNLEDLNLSFSPALSQSTSSEEPDSGFEGAALAKRPWYLIAEEAELSKFAPQMYELPDTTSWEAVNEKISKHWERYTKGEESLKNAIKGTLDTFEYKIGDIVDEYGNKKVREATHTMMKFADLLNQYAGSNFLSNFNPLLLTLGNTIADGAAQISQALKAKTSRDVAAMLMFGKGSNVLRESILNPEYLKGRFAVYEPSPPGEDLKLVIVNQTLEEKNYKSPFFVAKKISDVNASSGKVYDITFSKKQSKVNEANLAITSEYIEDPWKGENPQKLVKRTFKKTELDLLRNVITSLDAQMQMFVAFFTSVYQGKEHLLKLYSGNATEEEEGFSEYFYYFYTNGFDVNPIKKATTDFSYGAFKTAIALNKPDGNTTFSFNLPLDFQLSFWKFVAQEGLGVNLQEGIYSNNEYFDNNAERSINLNFVALQSLPKNLNSKGQFVMSVENARVNQFVLEKVYFSQAGDIAFNQSAGQLKNNVKGVYKRLKWYHNKLLKDFNF